MTYWCPNPVDSLSLASAAMCRFGGRRGASGQSVSGLAELVQLWDRRLRSRSVGRTAGHRRLLLVNSNTAQLLLENKDSSSDFKLINKYYLYIRLHKPVERQLSFETRDTCHSPVIYATLVFQKRKLRLIFESPIYVDTLSNCTGQLSTESQNVPVQNNHIYHKRESLMMGNNGSFAFVVVLLWYLVFTLHCKEEHTIYYAGKKINIT